VSHVLTTISSSSSRKYLFLLPMQNKSMWFVVGVEVERRATAYPASVLLFGDAVPHPPKFSHIFIRL
jgi:hypothetical protein